MWVCLLDFYRKNGSDYPKPSSELGCQQCPLDYDYNYILSSQESQIDSSCKIYPRYLSKWPQDWSENQGHAILSAPAKLLSWNQKPSLSQHVYSFASLQHVWTRLSERVPQDYLQLQRWCPWFDSHAVQDLPAPNIKFGAWSVGQDCMMSMFASECLLQDRPALSAN